MKKYFTDFDQLQFKNDIFCKNASAFAKLKCLKSILFEWNLNFDLYKWQKNFFFDLGLKFLVEKLLLAALLAKSISFFGKLWS